VDGTTAAGSLDWRGEASTKRAPAKADIVTNWSQRAVTRNTGKVTKRTSEDPRLIKPEATPGQRFQDALKEEYEAGWPWFSEEDRRRKAEGQLGQNIAAILRAMERANVHVEDRASAPPQTSTSSSESIQPCGVHYAANAIASSSFAGRKLG
jgi:hypothetical protein